MKTLTLKALGRDVEVFFTLNHYSMNNNLCINMVAVNEGPWSTLTKNFDVNLEPDEAFIDTNNNAGIDEILVANGIAEPTGKGIRSGFCIYPLFKFNLDVVEQYTCVCNEG